MLLFFVWCPLDPVPQGYWKNLENVRAYIDWLGTKLGYEHKYQQYNTTIQHIAIQYYCSSVVAADFFDTKIRIVVVV